MATRKHHLLRTLNLWIMALSDRHIPHMLVAVTGGFSVILGLLFWSDAADYRATPSFAVTFKYAYPQVWGGALALTGLIMVFLFWLDKTSGRAPAFILMMIYMALGFTAGAGSLLGTSPIFSASAVYTFCGIISAICIFACSDEVKGRSRVKAADHHLDD